MFLSDGFLYRENVDAPLIYTGLKLCKVFSGTPGSSMVLHILLLRLKSTLFKEYRCLKNGWLFLSPSFTEKFGLVFVLTLKNAFS